MHILTAEDFEQDDYDDTTIWCPACDDKGYKNRIGPKILLNNEPVPDNYEDLFECETCGYSGDFSMIPKHEEVTDKVEKVQSPYDDNLNIASIKKRRIDTGKQHMKRGRKRRKKKVLHHDPDVALAIKQIGPDNVRVLYDSNPR
jgi:hypothetical protein